MSKKLLFFISFVLVLVLAGNVSAIEWVATDLTGPPADILWSTISNWDQTRLPDVTDSTTYIGWRSLIDANHICLIDGTVTAECGGTLYLGKQAGDPGYWASLDITGGSLTTGTNPVYGGTFNVAYWGGEAGDVNMTDGTINVGGGSNLQVGNGDGYFDLKGGTVYVGDPNGGGGRLNCRYPGILNVAGGTVVLDSNDPTLFDQKMLI